MRSSAIPATTRSMAMVGSDYMVGGAGNDIYFVNNADDDGRGKRQRRQRHRLCLDRLHHRGQCELISAGGGTGAINGSGNGANNAVIGNSNNNVINGKGGHDFLIGNAGNDTFVFAAGEANGDMISDFNGNGGAAGDQFSLPAMVPQPKVRPSPRLAPPTTGRSTPGSTAITRPSRYRTVHRCTQATTCLSNLAAYEFRKIFVRIVHLSS